MASKALLEAGYNDGAARWIEEQIAGGNGTLDQWTFSALNLRKRGDLNAKYADYAGTPYAKRKVAMLYLFDLDGTLISSYMDEPGRNYHSWRVLPGRWERLTALVHEGHQIGIVTNQGGVAFGFVSEEEAHTKIGQALEALGLPDDTRVRVCFADSRSADPQYNDPAQVARRKPSGAMIREAIAAHHEAAEGTIYVGDRPEDEAAARDAGVAFVWAEEFFV